MKAFIILGCEGYQQGGFHFCNEISNIILDLESIENSDKYFDLIKYLDSVANIFEKPCGKQHIVTNAIYKIYQFGYINDEEYQKISYFYTMHKRCNLVLFAKPKI